MFKEIGSNYRLNGIGSVSSVRTNADSGSNAPSALACRLATLGVKGSKWLLTMQEPAKSAGSDCESHCVLNNAGKLTRGIAKYFYSLNNFLIIKFFAIWLSRRACRTVF